MELKAHAYTRIYYACFLNCCFESQNVCHHGGDNKTEDPSFQQDQQFPETVTDPCSSYLRR
jgi:hypothetical protein